MKKCLLLCLLLGSLWPAQAQSPSDQTLVLQHCLDLQQLQSYYPKDAFGNIRQLVILEHGVAFSRDLNVSKNGLAPAFLEKKDMVGGQADAYFLFNQVSIGEQKAHVVFAYYFAANSLVSVTLEMVRAGGAWSVINSKIEERHENN
jgi:hypothetical protein